MKKQTLFRHYLAAFQGAIFIIKIGGEVIENLTLLEKILRDIRYLIKHDIKVVLVHGGGPQADRLAARLGHVPTKIKGRRVTTMIDLEIAKMLYGGSLNLDILAILKKINVVGVGISGLDGNLLTVKKRKHAMIDFGFVGDIVSVQPKILRQLLQDKYLPVISPLAVTKDGTIVNINADAIAVAIAIDCRAKKLILCTNIDGILVKNNLLSTLTISEAKSLIINGTATDGMAVKLENCVQAVLKGVKQVHIINGLHPRSLLKEVLTKRGIGTMIVKTKKDVYDYK